ncbi:hypothetical protein [Phenylobacterium sp.]|uniref:hypothetical protein n=1 Tax=Phenylobacterium sp. TaxID=1871053 RepID=UPI00273243A7|nr:hypothetical protein [Phenylobacterium sp.]MDP3855331.1 hypothetical protein [Phenylobacterium sp.]
MAITTLDSIIAGLQPPTYYAKGLSGTNVVGRAYSWWRAINSISGDAAAPAGGVGGETLVSPVRGELMRRDPVSGNAYLARFVCHAGQVGQVTLADRIWQNSGLSVTSTAVQSIASPTWPARDEDGATLGKGFMLAVEIQSVMGAGGPTITVSYTNSAGVAGRTGTNKVSASGSSPAGTFYVVELQDGDAGVRSVQSIQLSGSWTSGALSLVAYRPLVHAAITGSHQPVTYDAMRLGLPRIYDGTVYFLTTIPLANSGVNVFGQIIEAHG